MIVLGIVKRDSIIKFASRPKYWFLIVMVRLFSLMKSNLQLGFCVVMSGLVYNMINHPPPYVTDRNGNTMWVNRNQRGQYQVEGFAVSVCCTFLIYHSKTHPQL